MWGLWLIFRCDKLGIDSNALIGISDSWLSEISKNHKFTNCNIWPVNPKILFWLNDKNSSDDSNPVKTSADIEFSRLPDKSKWLKVLKWLNADGGSSLITLRDNTREVILSETDFNKSLDRAVTLLKPRCTETKFGSRDKAVAGMSRILLSRSSRVSRLVSPSNASSSTLNKRG